MKLRQHFFAAVANIARRDFVAFIADASKSSRVNVAAVAVSFALFVARTL
jgi:hypothetical protein